MWYSVVFILASVLTGGSISRIAAQPLSPPIASEERCDQSLNANEQSIIGPYPIQVTVTSIDYANRAIDFATEVGTSLHVVHASAYELQQLKVGDKVELCIAEELRGDLQT
jgi:hypothetical protein